MSSTPVSLLQRLRRQPAEGDWQRLVLLYTPFLGGWLRAHGAPPGEVDDLVQEVLTVLVRELPHFEHNGRVGAFRAWLRGVAAHRLAACWRGRAGKAVAGGLTAALDQLADPASDLSRRWEREHDEHVLRRLEQLVQPEFQPATWEAFRLVVVEGRRAAEAAARLGISVNAVLIAKSRVLRRLRQEADGLIDS
jgi:RNA polymerase sigma-70 factor (ECF subfamily)